MKRPSLPYALGHRSFVDESYLLEHPDGGPVAAEHVCVQPGEVEPGECVVHERANRRRSDALPPEGFGDPEADLCGPSPGAALEVQADAADGVPFVGDCEVDRVGLDGAEIDPRPRPLDGVGPRMPGEELAGHVRVIEVRRQRFGVLGTPRANQVVASGNVQIQSSRRMAKSK